MNSPIIMLAYNQTPAQFDLTVKAVESALAQDIPVDLFLIDNGSTETRTWPYFESLAQERSNVIVERHSANLSPVLISNHWTKSLFDSLGYSYILGIANDVILPANFYRQLLRFPRGAVAASMTATDPVPCERAVAVNTCTPMAVALVRKWAYDALIARDGYFFDPEMFMYASDCDFALRLAACGITGVQLDIQYHHTPSSSWRLAPPDYARRACVQADRDRSYFERKYGFRVDDARYGQSAGDINFGAAP